MTLRETALANKSKQEMKLWSKIYAIAFEKGRGSAYAKMEAYDAIQEFKIIFNDHGNVL